MRLCWAVLIRIFCLSVRFCFLSSFVFFLGCICVPEHLMVLFTNEPELIAIGADYLRIAGWSYLLTGISQCYFVILKVIDHTADAAKRVYSSESGRIMESLSCPYRRFYALPVTDDWRSSALGRGIYFLYCFYGTYGNRCGSSQFDSICSA